MTNTTTTQADRELDLAIRELQSALARKRAAVDVDRGMQDLARARVRAAARIVGRLGAD